MSPADVRLTAQLVVDRRVNCVSDEAVMALARRVLELEELLRIDMTYGERLSIGVLKAKLERAETAAAHWEGVAAANALDVVTEVAAEREACAKVAETWRPLDPHGEYIAAAIRARGAK